MVTDKEGAYLVKLAREAIAAFLAKEVHITPDKRVGELGEPRGVFVTLRTHPGEELRGCIGYPQPIKPLADAVVNSALNAAFDDPRFSPISAGELDHITIEVTVLSGPELIRVKDPADYEKHVIIGRDGLIIEYGYRSGLLLPQVPIEQNWRAKEFLDNLCVKAGLPPSMWKSANVKIYKFHGDIFEEDAPRGNIKKKRLMI